ncbi:hypothetical protein O4H66_14545 [Comamonadaceae bacterium G21597-S1]|nr:hypothetical protein [Comamonadaceae bacterium G21597-S1]
MLQPEATYLTKTVTVAKYRELEAAGDRVASGRFIVERFYERYFEPTVGAPKRHGFTLVAVGCLVIETLECFYEGKATSQGCSRAIFRNFFTRPTGLEALGRGGDWFYRDIRCGILHQAETCKGWRIRRSGPLLDATSHSINAKRFIVLLQKAVEAYAINLAKDPALWENFRTKMDAICNNCIRED